MFDINNYKYDKEHNYLEIGGEAMIFHCHHYITILLKTILDAEFIDSQPFLIGSAADAVYNQFSNLSKGLDIEESKILAQEIYRTFGYGLIDLSSMNEDGGKFSTKNSFFSKTWKMKFGQAKKPIDYYTSGFLAGVYAVIYKKELKDVYSTQVECMTCGDSQNSFILKAERTNFKVYPPKKPISFNKTQKQKINWEFEKKVTNVFINSHTTMIGNEDSGLIKIFGVYLVRNQSDYVNRLQIEFMDALIQEVGEYGITLGGELLMEAGHACGFFTFGGIMTSPEWKNEVQPYLKTKEDWIRGLCSVVNTVGWGYHTIVELSENKTTFRNYNDFEDLSYMRMYGNNKFPVHWANSGGFTGLMQLVYNTSLVETGILKDEDGFREMRRSTVGYKTKMTKGISCGDDYLEVVVYK